jgi:hypothetical protein
MRKYVDNLIITFMGTLLLMACSRQPEHVRKVNQWPVIYPDYVDVTIPDGIAPLNFSMADDAVTTVDVQVAGAKGGSLHVNGDYADFDIEEWHALLKRNRGAKLTFTVCAEKDGQWTQYRDFTVTVSEEPLGEWGVTYRRIAPSFEIYSKMGLYQRDLSNFDEETLISNAQMYGMCVNCHTANQTNPDQYVFHIRGEHGATAIHREGKIEMIQAKNEQLGGSMVYPGWHPGGRYCAFSTNKTSQMFHTSSIQRIDVYDASSDVFVYDTQTHTILQDTLIMKKYWAENCPNFSPDGKWLYFTTARRQIYPTDYDKEKYSLCRVSFDAETGRIGTEVDTLVNTAHTGKSVSWPRASYDGRFLMYAEADYGYFTVWHPEAELWLYDLKNGTTRRIDEVNSKRSESLHAWSKNSHWFLFTSRRDDGLYTRLYFAGIDTTGHATKPFLLPQRNPKEYYRRLMYSYNTPDFTEKPVDKNSRPSKKMIEEGERIQNKVRN